MQGAMQSNFHSLSPSENDRQQSAQTLLHQVIGGRYRVLEILGLGGFGKTYVSADLQRPGEPKCVLKHLHFSSQDEEMLKQARRMFAQEAAILERLGKHDQIPQLLAYFEEAGEFYLVQELVAGHPLSREIPEGQALTQGQTIEMLVDVLQILDFVHEEGVIHRDLKPENLIRRSRDRRFVMIDFGAVKTIGAQIQPIDYVRSIPVYTTGYAASEQCLGKPQFNSDLYSLGMIAIQCLTGSHPSFIDYDVKTGAALWQGTVDADLRLIEILEKMTEYRSSDRYASVQDVLVDLEPLLELVETFEGMEPTFLAPSGSSKPSLPRSHSFSSSITRPVRSGPVTQVTQMTVMPLNPTFHQNHGASLSSLNSLSVSESSPASVAPTQFQSPAQSPAQSQELTSIQLPAKSRSRQLSASIISILAVSGFGLFVWHPMSPLRHQMLSQVALQNSLMLSKSDQPTNDALLISQGSQLLFPETQDRRALIDAIALAQKASNPMESLAKLKLLRDRIPNDPEALIYLNNFQAASTSQTYKIAAVLPFTQFPEASAELLRGIAQAQDQLNRRGGIGGKRVTLVLADDRNQPELARKIAQRLSEMPDVLGVIGHGGSDTTLSASEIYTQHQLVTIAPISSATQLSGHSPYLYRTMPSDRLPAKALGQYMSDRLKKRRAIVFFNSTSTYSQSLKSEFKNALFYHSSGTSTPGHQAEIVSEVDLAKPDFNPTAALKEAIAKKAEVIVLANGLSDLDRSLLIMQMNQNRLPILAGDAFYTDTVLQAGATTGPGLTLAIPSQHLGLTRSAFQQQAKQLWQQTVTWRSALAFDATSALTQALTQAATHSRFETSNIAAQREQIRRSIARSDFQVMGSVRQIRFNKSGDPLEAIQLVKLTQNPQTRQPEFLPLK